MKPSHLASHLSVFFLIAAVAASSQSGTRLLSTTDSDDLYARMSKSGVVMVGTAIDFRAILKRPSPELVEEMKRNVRAGIAGSLFRVRVDQTICRKSDFFVEARSHNQLAAKIPAIVNIFVPQDEQSFFDGRQMELLTQGQRYLLFLVDADTQRQREWTSKFRLDPNDTYYRGEEFARGVIPLPTAGLGEPGEIRLKVLSRVQRLGDALRLSTLASKLEALRRLQGSDDPVLRREAEFAALDLKSRSSRHID